MLSTYIHKIPNSPTTQIQLTNKTKWTQNVRTEQFLRGKWGEIEKGNSFKCLLNKDIKK